MQHWLLRILPLGLLAAVFPLMQLSSAGAVSDASALPVRIERMGPYGGDVRSLLIDAQDPETVFLGTSNGRIFKSSDAGRSWAVLRPGIGPYRYVIDTLVQHPKEHSRIYAGAWDLHSEGGGLFESPDAGASWKRVPLPRPDAAVRGVALCRDHPERMAAATLDGVYVSADGGRSWEKVGGEELHKAESVAIDPVDYRFLYVGTWRLAYRSSDFGKTWTRVGKGMPLDSDVFSVAVNAKNPAVVYSSACSGVYRSQNRAQSWSRLKLLPDRFTIRAHLVAIDPEDANVVYSGTTEGLFVSRNAGQNWVRLTAAGVTVNALQVHPRNSRSLLLGTEYQGVLRSEDGGRSWKESNTGFVHKQVSWIAPDAAETGHFMAGIQSGAGGVYHYHAREGMWTPSQISPGMRILSFLILPDNRGNLAGTVQGVYWQRGDGKEWTKLQGAIALRTVYSLVLDPEHHVLYAGTDRGIYRSSLEAMKFRAAAGSRLSPQAWCLAMSPGGSEFVYAGTSLGLLRSYDRGTTWNIISAYGFPQRARIESLAISPEDKDHLFAATSVGLYESRNGGIHWRRIEDTRIGGAVGSVMFVDGSGSRILSSNRSAGGLLYSADGGQTWSAIYSAQLDSPIYCLVGDPQRPSRVYIGTQSEGVFSLDFH